MTGTGWHVRRHLVAGLIVIAPVGITAYVLWVIFQWLDQLLGRFLYPALGVSIPGLGLVALLALLIVVGWLAERAIGARALGWWNAFLERIPIARRIYSASNRIVRTVLGEERRFFRDVVMVEYPAEGRWSIGFLTADAPPAMRQQVPDGVTVFVPTTPNPTTGFLAVLPRDRVVPLSMSLEDAFTYILSAGAVAPEEIAAGAVPAAEAPP
ncbi:MAG: DUF502 domain-containing protein [Gemmatimonadetes bacterium]|nr:DUF502 domain-containing protein [Gemmatimonadota bacterium]